METEPRLSRRQFVTGTSSALLVSAGALALGGCTSFAPRVSSPTSRALALPTYVPLEQGSKPDLPGDARGLDAGFYSFPTELLRTVTNPPGDGSAVSAIMVQPLAAPPPVEQNTAWQAVNKALNVDLGLTMVPNSEYQVRLATVLAGPELPDFIYDYTNTNPYGVIPSLPAFAAARCADLTPFLSGDAVKDYPNLAHYNTLTWRSSVVNGKLYGIPISRAPTATVLAYRADLLADAGVQLTNAPKDAADFKRILLAADRPEQRQFAFYASPQTALGLHSGGLLAGIFNVPNGWRLGSDGKLVKDFETEEFKAAVAFVKELWSAGVFHPDTLSLGGGQANTDFAAGRVVVMPAAWGQFPDLWNLTATASPRGRVGGFAPFAHDGGKPSYLAGPSHFGWTFIKQQSSAERVKMLLRIANFFAAPFGSQEWLLNYYGVEGVDYTFNSSGSPQPTDRGRAELTATWKYITSPAYPLFNPIRSREYVDTLYPLEQAMLAALVSDPTQGLYSETALTKGSAEQAALYAGVVDVVVGRRPFSDLSTIVAEWRERAGERTRAELQEALQRSRN